MSKLTLLLSAIFLATLLSACTSTKMGNDKMGDGMTTKCPACGHEFDSDPPGGGSM